MSFILITAIAAAAASPSQPAPVPIKSARDARRDCPRTASYQAFDRNGKVAPRKLGELPSANAYNAVYRTVDGCEVPVIVRFDVRGR